MKKIICTLLSVLAYLGALAQVREFSAEISPSFDNQTIKLDPQLFSGDYSDTKDYVDVLAISADCTVFDPDTKLFAPMKGNIFSILAFQNTELSVTKQDSSATIFASINKNQKDAVLGDGGGVIFFKVQRTPSGEWKVIPNGKAPNDRLIYFQNVSFKSVGGTVGNTELAYIGTANNTTQRIFAIEDASSIHSNKDLIGFSDTSNFVYPGAFTQATQGRSPIPINKSVPRYLAQGFPVEIDALSGKVISKFHRAGRGITSLTTGGGKMYFVYGGNPSVLLRYAPYGQYNSFAQQQLPSGGDPSIGGDGGIYLSAYKQNPDGTGDFSIPIALKVDSVAIENPDPNGTPFVNTPKYTQIFDSLLVAKDIALRAGATMFANVGDIAYSFDEYGYPILLISEKGRDDSGDEYSNPSKKYNGTLAQHLSKRDTLDGTIDGKFSDPYGRILVMNNLDGVGLSTNIDQISTLIEGGASKSGSYFFSNPDKMEMIQYDPNSYATFFCVKENIPNADKGRNPSFVEDSKKVNEAYFATFAENGQGIFPYAEPNGPIVAPLSLENDFKLYEAGSNGSVLSSSREYTYANGGTFITNSKINGGSSFDTYLTVVNGYNGTDKSMIVAVRNVTTFAVGLFEDELMGNKKKLAAWPNPSKGHLTTPVVSDYSITDLSGQSLKSFSHTNELDISELEKGMYILKMTSTGSTMKIVLE